MAITTNIPPQAYTRDTLVKAIEWISHQPAAVRERANSADLIVSFYLQARRRMTAAQLEAPVSGETFKQDLKHLAQDLKQFEDPSAAPPPLPNRALSHGPFELPDPLPPPPIAATHTPTPAQQHLNPPAQASGVQKGVTWQVDNRSLAAARELQERLNLSNEGDALRMLIMLGVERMRDLLPS